MKPHTSTKPHTRTYACPDCEAIGPYELVTVTVTDAQIGYSVACAMGHVLRVHALSVESWKPRKATITRKAAALNDELTVIGSAVQLAKLCNDWEQVDVLLADISGAAQRAAYAVGDLQITIRGAEV